MLPSEADSSAAVATALKNLENKIDGKMKKIDDKVSSEPTESQLRLEFGSQKSSFPRIPFTRVLDCAIPLLNHQLWGFTDRLPFHA